jgi:hypothetical protein
MIFRGSTPSFYTEYEAPLVEEAVLLRLGEPPGEPPEERRFRRERNPIYEIADAKEREKQFRDLHAKWFVRLDLHRPILEVLHEYPSISTAARFCRVSSTIGAQQETADLHDLYDPSGQGHAPHTAVLLRVRPARLLDATSLKPWLHHELLHIADIVDPDFNYQRVFPTQEAGSAHANLVRERYRVLWDTWIDGRLFRRGKLEERARERRRDEFLATFAMLGAEAENWFSRLWESDCETHAGLMSLASEPRGPLPAPSDRPTGSRVCPLCRFPSFDWLDERSDFPFDLEGEIRSDFPDWDPRQGLCRQCADLYRARQAVPS